MHSKINFKGIGKNPIYSSNGTEFVLILKRKKVKKEN